MIELAYVVVMQSLVVSVSSPTCEPSDHRLSLCAHMWVVTLALV